MLYNYKKRLLQRLLLPFGNLGDLTNASSSSGFYFKTEFERPTDFSCVNGRTLIFAPYVSEAWKQLFT